MITFKQITFHLVIWHVELSRSGLFVMKLSIKFVDIGWTKVQ